MILRTLEWQIQLTRNFLSIHRSNRIEGFELAELMFQVNRRETLLIRFAIWRELLHLSPPFSPSFLSTSKVARSIFERVSSLGNIFSFFFFFSVAWWKRIVEWERKRRMRQKKNETMRRKMSTRQKKRRCSLIKDYVRLIPPSLCTSIRENRTEHEMFLASASASQSPESFRSGTDEKICRSLRLSERENRLRTTTGNELII